MKAVREPHVACYITPALGRGGESCTHCSRSIPAGITAYETADMRLPSRRVRYPLPIVSQRHLLVGCIGFEPMHFRLRGGCSTN
jgi:hypothetical protein